MLRVKSSLNVKQLAELATRQINCFFPDSEEVHSSELIKSVPVALERLEHCFSHIKNKYFFDDRDAVFDHLHGDQYAMWLYFLGNEHFRQQGSIQVCKKLFLLNKALHGCDIFYEVDLPSIFLLVHPLGTVLGRGVYQDYFLAYQRCGIGSNHNVYPRLGSNLTLRPGSAVLGNSAVGNGCVISADSLVIDHELPEDTVYFGNPSTFKTRANKEKEEIWRI